MKIDLRYKNAPLFAISIALSLSATTMAEAAPVAVKAGSVKRPHNPDEAVRSMTAAQLGSVGVVQPASNFPRPSEVIPSALNKLAQKSPSVVTGVIAPQASNTAMASGTSPLDSIIAGITNKSSGQAAPKAIYIPASPPQTKAVRPASPPVSRPAASSELSQANLPSIATANVPVADLPFPDVENNTNPAQEQSKAPKETFIAQPSGDKEAFTNNQWTNLSGIGNLTNKLVSNSQKMVLSIRSDSSALLSMGSARLEIPAAFSSRLILGSRVKNSQLPNLNAPDPGVLSIQIPRRGSNSAMRLLLTQKSASEVSTLVVQNEQRKSVAFSVIGAHRFSDKPNV
jgi:hypothetical protein